MGSTYGDAVEHAMQLEGAFDECDVEIESLNQWVKQHNQNDIGSHIEVKGTPKG